MQTKTQFTHANVITYYYYIVYRNDVDSLWFCRCDRRIAFGSKNILNIPKRLIQMGLETRLHIE